MVEIDLIMSLPLPDAASGFPAFSTAAANRFLNVRVQELAGRCEADESCLFPCAEKQPFRIRQRSSVDEAEPDTVRACSYRQYRIARTLGRRISDHKEVIVVIDQFVGGGKPSTHGRSNGADEFSVIG